MAGIFLTLSLFVSQTLSPSFLQESVSKWHQRDEQVAATKPDASLFVAPSTLCPQVGATVSWEQGVPFVSYKNQLSVHFLLESVDVLDADAHAIGCEWYIATEASKQKGAYDIKVRLEQDDYAVVLAVFDKDGKRISGAMPRYEGQGSERNHILPWRDGMRLYYSLVVERVEGQMRFVCIQHQLSAVRQSGQLYLPAFIDSMLSDYAGHECLYNRRGGYLDNPLHMRVLSVPHSNALYRCFESSEQLFFTCAVVTGAVRISR